MNLHELPAFLVVLSMTVNVVDRLLTGRGSLFAFPRTGRLRQAFLWWTVVMVALATLSLFRVVPVIYFIASGAVGMVLLQICAVFLRHTQLTAQ